MGRTALFCSSRLSTLARGPAAQFLRVAIRNANVHGACRPPARTAPATPLLAQVWDDKSLLNVDFSLICSNYSLKDINQLEKQFLELIQYNVSISSSLYASYYFELRTLCEKAERTFSLKPLSEEQQQARARARVPLTRRAHDAALRPACHPPTLRALLPPSRR